MFWMTLPEAELSRSRRAPPKKFSPKQRAKRKLEIAKARKQRLDLLPAVLNDNQVLRFQEWCALNDISPRTARRLFARGDGPATTQLSPKRIGITVRANKEWQARRERAS
jgi:ABC-type siderophore export system fused ATPase/permease subunit